MSAKSKIRMLQFDVFRQGYHVSQSHNLNFTSPPSHQCLVLLLYVILNVCATKIAGVILLAMTTFVYNKLMNEVI